MGRPGSAGMISPSLQSPGYRVAPMTRPADEDRHGGTSLAGARASLRAARNDCFYTRGCQGVHQEPADDEIAAFAGIVRLI